MTIDEVKSHARNVADWSRSNPVDAGAVICIVALAAVFVLPAMHSREDEMLKMFAPKAASMLGVKCDLDLDDYHETVTRKSGLKTTLCTGVLRPEDTLYVVNGEKPSVGHGLPAIVSLVKSKKAAAGIKFTAKVVQSSGRSATTKEHTLKAVDKWPDGTQFYLREGVEGKSLSGDRLVYVDGRLVHGDRRKVESVVKGLISDRGAALERNAAAIEALPAKAKEACAFDLEGAGVRAMDRKATELVGVAQEMDATLSRLEDDISEYGFVNTFFAYDADIAKRFKDDEAGFESRRKALVDTAVRAAGDVRAYAEMLRDEAKARRVAARGGAR